MKKIRMKSAKFGIRESFKKHHSFLWLDSPYPQIGDYEWGLRINIDKYKVLIDNPEVEDGGSGSSGLCAANSNLSNRDDQCGGCPIKEYTGAPNCLGTFLDEDYWNAITYQHRVEVRRQMLEFLSDMYKRLYGREYIPEVFVEE